MDISRPNLLSPCLVSLCSDLDLHRTELTETHFTTLTWPECQLRPLGASLARQSFGDEQPPAVSQLQHQQTTRIVSIETTTASPKSSSVVANHIRP